MEATPVNSIVTGYWYLIATHVDKRYVDIKSINGVKNRSSFSQIKDEKFKPLGIYPHPPHRRYIY